MKNLLSKKRMILIAFLPFLLLASCKKELSLSTSSKSLSTRVSDKDNSTKEESSIKDSSKGTSEYSSKTSSHEKESSSVKPSSSKESSSSKSSSSTKPTTPEPHVHDFVEVLIKEATCYESAMYVRKCTKCGAVDGKPYHKGSVKPHEFTEEIAEYEYLKDKDKVLGGTLFKKKATYYKACKHCHKSAEGLDEDAIFTSTSILKAQFGYYPQTKATDIEKTKLQTVTSNDGIFTLGENRFIKDKDEFYKLELITWNVFLRNESTYTLMTDKIIDDGAFIYPNKYHDDRKTQDRRCLWLQSKVRDFLNIDFYNNAFNKYAGKDLRGEINTNYLSNGEEANSFDKVFLLSSDEMRDSKSTMLSTEEIKNMTWTDYAYSLINKDTQDTITPKAWTRSNANWRTTPKSTNYEYINDAYVLKNYKGQVNVVIGSGKYGVMPAITMKKETFLKYKLNK